jgi:hypothetical protein
MKVRRGRVGRVSQGDIYKDVEFVEYVAEEKGIIEISKIVFPFITVLTQDCDLEQDSKIRCQKISAQTQDKLILSVLVSPLYNVEQVYIGEHLAQLGIKMQMINRKNTPGKYLRINEIPRYHYIEFPEGVAISPSVIDFKHYFSVNVEYLRRKKSDLVYQVSPLYREDISHRFASFLSRIGLPEVKNAGC